jgi:uncharacterized membrane protein
MEEKEVSFVICLIGALSGIIGGAISYLNYAATEYENLMSVLFPIIGGLVGLLLAILPQTRPLAAIAIFAGNLIGFAQFINGTYMYLTDVFYGGVNAQAFAELDKYFVISLVTLLVGLVCGNIALYVKD